MPSEVLTEAGVDGLAPVAGGADGSGGPYSPAVALGRRPELTGLRTPLAIGVLVAHNALSWQAGEWCLLSLWFALSGFLITSILLRERAVSGAIHLGRFFTRRALRLLPALFLLVGVLYLYAALVHVDDAGQRINGDVLATVLYVMDFREAFNHEPFVGFLGQCWTLAVEEQFYLVWAPLLVLAVRRGGRRLVLLVAAVGLLASTADREVLWFLEHSVDRAYYAFDTRVDSLAAGCILGILFSWGWLSRGDPSMRRRLAWIAGTCTVFYVWVLFYVPRTAPAPFVWAISATTIAAVAILAHVVASPEGRAARLLRWRPIVHLGTITYGIYLWHWPVYAAIEQSAIPNLWLLLVVRVVVTLAFSELSWYFVEQPLTRLRKTRFAAQTMDTASAVAQLTTAPVLEPAPEPMTLKPVAAAAPTRASRRSVALWVRYRLDVVVVGGLLALLALALGGEFAHPGGPLEEGLMLYLPTTMLHGAAPYSDFNYAYGPGGLWLLSALYSVFGSSIVVERLVAFAFQIATVVAAYSAGRLVSRRAATTAGLLAAVFSTVLLLQALPWLPAVALLLGAFVVLTRARQLPAGRRQRWLAGAGGVLAALSVLFRADMILAALPMVSLLCVDRRRPGLRQAAWGALVVVGSYVVVGLTSGVGATFHSFVVQPFDMASGNHLPIPPSPTGSVSSFLSAITPPPAWPLPTLRPTAELFAWFGVVLVAVVVTISAAVVALRSRRPARTETRSLAAAAVMCVVAFLQVVERDDSYHLAEASCLIAPLTVFAVASLLRRRSPRSADTRWARRLGASRLGAAVVVVVPLLAMSVLVPDYTIGLNAQLVATTVGAHSYGSAHASGPTSEGRWFVVSPASTARDVDELLAETARVTEPGDLLFVGPGDLRRTPYSDAYLYWLLPELVPSTTFINMYPYIGLRQSAQLATDVQAADVVILNSAWESWREPNSSSTPGPDTVPALLQADFCLDGTFGPMEVLVHRADSHVLDPADCAPFGSS